MVATPLHRGGLGGAAEVLNKSCLRSILHPALWAAAAPSASTAPALLWATPTTLPQDIAGQSGVIYTRNLPLRDISGETVPGVAPSALCSPQIWCEQLCISTSPPWCPTEHAGHPPGFTLWAVQHSPCLIPNDWAEQNTQRTWWLFNWPI